MSWRTFLVWAAWVVGLVLAALGIAGWWPILLVTVTSVALVMVYRRVIGR